MECDISFFVLWPRTKTTDKCIQVRLNKCIHTRRPDYLTKKEKTWSPRKKNYSSILQTSPVKVHIQNWHQFTTGRLWLLTVPQDPEDQAQVTPPLISINTRGASASQAFCGLYGKDLFIYVLLFLRLTCARRFRVALRTYLPSVGASQLLQWFEHSRPRGFVCHLHRGPHAYGGEGPAGQGGETLGKLSIQKSSRKIFGNKRDQVKQERVIVYYMTKYNWFNIYGSMRMFWNILNVKFTKVKYFLLAYSTHVNFSHSSNLWSVLKH